jgi:hypothetical protein
MKNIVKLVERALRHRTPSALLCALALLRPLAGNANAPAGRFEVGSNTVFDNVTRLTWQRAPSGSTYTWTGARDYCLLLSGGNWRLPTCSELETLVDVSRLSPAIDTDAFPNTSTGDFWTSTPYAPDASKVWAVGFDDGGSYFDGVSRMNHARCVL